MILVIGGGITGQLVQHIIPEAEILDWRPRPPSRMTRAFGANYLWEPLEGIPCRSFPVVTHVDGKPPTDEAIIRYKKKIGKMHDIENWGMQFVEHTTGYEITQLPEPRIHWDRRVIRIDGAHRSVQVDGPRGKENWSYSHLISTIPLYALMDMVVVDFWPADLLMPALEYKPIFVKVTARPPDAPYPPDTWYVNYLSSEVSPYRVTDRETERHYESIVPMSGIPSRRISPGKIYPHAHAAQVVARLQEWGQIQCFGRFARWNPDELVHQTYRDILQWRDTYVPMANSGVVYAQLDARP